MSKQLVIQLARLGDIMQTKRLMLSLKNEGTLALLVDKNLIALAQKIYPYAHIFGVYINTADPNILFEENISTFSALKNEHFDTIYPLNYSAFSQKICTLFAPEKLRGYSRTGVYTRHSLWGDFAFRWMKDRRITPLNLMDFWANFAPNPIAPENVNPVAQAKGKGIGVVLSGQNPRRSLAPKDYAKIIHAIYEREKKNIGKDVLIFFGTQAECAFAKELSSFLPSSLQNKIQNLAGKTNLEELLENIQGLDLLLSPDTGIAHIAAHFGVPVEGFYLSSAHCFETGPYGLGHVVWQISMEVREGANSMQKIPTHCSPCMEFQECPYGEKNEQGKQDFSSLPCHKAFQSPAFLMRLDEKKYTEEVLTKQTLENVVKYTSSFLEYDEVETCLKQKYAQGVQGAQVEKGERIVDGVKAVKCVEVKAKELAFQDSADKSNAQETKSSFGLTWLGNQLVEHKKARQKLRILLNAYAIASKRNALTYDDLPPVFDTSLYEERDFVFPKLLP